MITDIGQIVYSDGSSEACAEIISVSDPKTQLLSCESHTEQTTEVRRENSDVYYRITKKWPGGGSESLVVETIAPDGNHVMIPLVTGLVDSIDFVKSSLPQFRSIQYKPLQVDAPFESTTIKVNADPKTAPTLYLSREQVLEKVRQVLQPK